MDESNYSNLFLALQLGKNLSKSTFQHESCDFGAEYHPQPSFPDDRISPDRPHTMKKLN
jgi:hypothetical protein